MNKFKEYIALDGSHRVPVIGAHVVGPADAQENFGVTVALRSRRELDPAALRVLDPPHRMPATTAQDAGVIEAEATPGSDLRRHLTHEEFLESHGALPEDLSKVEEFAQEYNLTIVEASLAKRSVVLSGSAAKFGKAFQVDLREYEHDGKHYRGRTGPIHIPTELGSVVKAVLGLDNRPQARPRFRARSTPNHLRSLAEQPPGSFTPSRVAELYGFPKNADGEGQCIGLIELGGGFTATEMQHYFSDILKMPIPKVLAVSVDGVNNSPSGDIDTPDSEVVLDIQVAGAVAPKSTIVVYFSPNTDAGFFDSISAAVHDTQHKPSVISISWGAPESTWTQQALLQFNSVLQDAATLGITVCVASGDFGSEDGMRDGFQHVGFPASSPFALSCGGTKLVASNNTITEETVWNQMDEQGGATGGGVSDFFSLPPYQGDAGVPPSKNPGSFVGRGVPDVAGNADVSTGYYVYIDGLATVIAGTSAVAPLWGGLIALANQLGGKRLGCMNPFLYAKSTPRSIFHNITKGNNGAFSAGPGWNACTGWGSPNGAELIAALGLNKR